MLESYLRRLHNKELYQRRIKATDLQTDALVYELTEEKIEIGGQAKTTT
jgi:hypothetical protein